MIATVRRLALAALLLVLPTVAAAQTYTISPPPFLLAQNNSGTIINNACIWTYTAGTTTPAATYTTSTGTANSNPIRSDSAGRFTAYLAPGSSYKFVYESACVPPAHGTTLRTADNISATPTSSAGVDVVGTAGESITAGQAIYLSDGSGGKTAGQWYKADSAAAYSSTGNWVGLATVNIASAASGTIRIAGSVTGLSALTLGATYYVGTAGALTSTAPTNARKLGEADTATSLVVTANPPIALTGATIGQVLVAQGSSSAAIFQAQGFFNDFRLSLTTATCLTTADVTGASAGTLYLTPCTGNRITLFDTSGNPETCSTAEVSIAVPASTSQMYDVFAFNDARLAPARDAGAARLDERHDAGDGDCVDATAAIRSPAITSRLYVGSFRTTTVSGQTEDSITKRYVWNNYNRVRRTLERFETTASWNYSTATVRQANGATANQVEIVVGVQEATLDLNLNAAANNNGAVVAVSVGIGEDSTTTYTKGWFSAAPVTTAIGVLGGRMTKQPAIGRHFYSWNEWSAATPTTTWFAANAAVGSTVNSGLEGWIEG
jgi:hypothetical protein